MELLGKGYIIDHCIAYSRKQSRDNIFRAYITDALKVIADNTSMGANGFSTLTARYVDLIDPNYTDEEDAEIKSKEIISNIKNKLAKLGRKEET